MSAADEALRILQEAQQPAAVPTGSYTTFAEPETAATPSRADEALRILGMSPKDLAKSQAETASPGVGQRAGSFATGANDAIAAALGAPFDFSAWLGNQAVRGIDALAGRPTVQPVTRPWLGSENIRDWLSGAVGRTEPKDEIDRLLAGAGAGAGSAATGMLAGGALQAAGRAPFVAKMLLGGGDQGLLAAAGNAVTGAGGGVGSVAAGDAVRAMGGGETAQALAGMAGGLGGGLVTGLAPPLAYNAAVAARAAARPFSESGRQGIAGRILNESSTYGEPTIGPVPLGISPMLGQASNDPGLLAMERTVQQASPTIQGNMLARASENNQTIRGAFDLLGNPAGRAPYQISQEAATGLEANRAAAREAEGAVWGAVDPTNSILVPMQPIRQRMQDYIDSLTMARRPLVPDDLTNMVMRSGGADALPMRELQDIRSALTTRERMARMAGDYNQANVYRNMDEALFQRIPEGAGPLPATADQAAQLRYQNALDASRQYNQTFNAKPIRDIFRVEGTPDSAVLDKMLAPGQGQAERVQQYTRAAMGDPTLMQHGRDWFTSRLGDAVASARQDTIAGDPFVLGNKLETFVRQNRPLIDSPLFTPEQRQVIDSMVEAATMVERTARAGATGGSDTAAKLAGKDYVSALVGNWFKPLAALEGVGAAAGGTFGLGGAAAGAVAANRVAGPMLQKAYSGAAEKVMNLLGDAMLDPVFAKELMRNATPANAGFASPKLQNFIATLPGTLSAAPR